MNDTAVILGPQDAWAAAELHLDSVHPFWGGHRLELHGDGTCTVAIYGRGGFHQRSQQLQLAVADVQALFAALLDADVFGNPPAQPASLLPDSASSLLRLRSGERESVLTFWEHQLLPPALAAVHRQLLEVVQQVRSGG